MSTWQLPTTLGLIWAQDKRGAIGGDGTVPWNVPENLARIDTVTAGHPVVMGRRTWESLPPGFRPFADRQNYVISRNDDFAPDGAIVISSLDDALELISTSGDDEAWIIGGGQILSEAVGQANSAIVSEIAHSYNGNIYAPGLGSEWELVATEPSERWSASGVPAQFSTRTYRKA